MTAAYKLYDFSDENADAQAGAAQITKPTYKKANSVNVFEEISSADYLKNVDTSFVQHWPQSVLDDIDKVFSSVSSFKKILGIICDKDHVFVLQTLFKNAAAQVKRQATETPAISHAMVYDKYVVVNDKVFTHIPGNVIAFNTATGCFVEGTFNLIALCHMSARFPIEAAPMMIIGADGSVGAKEKVKCQKVIETISTNLGGIPVAASTPEGRTTTKGYPIYQARHLLTLSVWLKEGRGWLPQLFFFFNGKIFHPNTFVFFSLPPHIVAFVKGYLRHLGRTLPEYAEAFTTLGNFNEVTMRDYLRSFEMIHSVGVKLNIICLYLCVQELGQIYPSEAVLLRFPLDTWAKEIAKAPARAKTLHQLYCQVKGTSITDPFQEHVDRTSFLNWSVSLDCVDAEKVLDGVCQKVREQGPNATLSSAGEVIPDGSYIPRAALGARTTNTGQVNQRAQANAAAPRVAAKVNRHDADKFCHNCNVKGHVKAMCPEGKMTRSERKKFIADKLQKESGARRQREEVVPAP